PGVTLPTHGQLTCQGSKCLLGGHTPPYDAVGAGQQRGIGPQMQRQDRFKAALRGIHHVADFVRLRCAGPYGRFPAGSQFQVLGVRLPIVTLGCGAHVRRRSIQ
ncbi:MAG: hypothetical protein ACK56F_02965, partial [bacterium]